MREEQKIPPSLYRREPQRRRDMIVTEYALLHKLVVRQLDILLPISVSKCVSESELKLMINFLSGLTRGRPEEIIFTKEKLINKIPFSDRNCDDDEAAIQAFIDTGKYRNTEKSRALWGSNFIQHLNKRKLTLAQMNNFTLMDEELTRFYYSMKKKNSTPFEVSSMRTYINWPSLNYISQNIPGLSGKLGSIYNGTEFAKTRGMLDALFKEGAKEGMYVGKHKTVLTDEQEHQIVSSFDINTPIGLLKRVCYTVSQYGCFRGQGCLGFPVANVTELP